MFHDDLVELLHLAREGASITAHALPPEFERIFSEYIAAYMEWQPLSAVPARNRPLLTKLRYKVMQLFGGRLPHYLPLPRRCVSDKLELFLREGTISFKAAEYTPRCFREDLRAIFSLKRRGTTFMSGAPSPRNLDHAYSATIAESLDWTSTNAIPIANADLVELAREHVLARFDGDLPYRHPLDATKRAHALSREFLRSGVLSEPTPRVARRLVDNLEKYVFGIECRPEGTCVPAPPPQLFTETATRFLQAYAVPIPRTLLK